MGLQDAQGCLRKARDQLLVCSCPVQGHYCENINECGATHNLKCLKEPYDA